MLYLDDKDKEEEEFFDDWEDENYDEVDEDLLEEDGADEDVLIDAPKKKGGGVGFFLVLLMIVILGLGGGYYYISIPQGAAVRAMIPPEILNKIPLLPVGNSKQQMAQNNNKASIKQEQPVASNEMPSMDNNKNDIGFSAPPMPGSDTDDSFDDKPEMVEDDFANNMADNTGMADKGFDSGKEDIPSIDFSKENNSFDTASDDVADTSVKNMATDFEANAPVEVKDIEAKKSNISDMEFTDSSASSFSDKNVAVKSEDIIAIEDRLASLEKSVVSKSELAALESRISNRFDSDIASLKASLEQISKDINYLKTKSISKQNKTKQAVSAVKQTKEHSNYSNTKKATKHKAKSSYKNNWVLQSALPGQAWLKDKEKGNRLRVSVGDNVKALGKITAIEQDKKTGAWIVRGTKGSVKQ